ncbi:hypothetical protein EDB85DRAFT_329425 [Lactarius pseudohatsudake]|nr:hypothetical protein EDB85DRAFT_329425 [Lactarius pseudohatsudake]
MSVCSRPRMGALRLAPRFWSARTVRKESRLEEGQSPEFAETYERRAVSIGQTSGTCFALPTKFGVTRPSVMKYVRICKVFGDERQACRWSQTMHGPLMAFKWCSLLPARARSAQPVIMSSTVITARPVWMVPPLGLSGSPMPHYRHGNSRTPQPHWPRPASLTWSTRLDWHSDDSYRHRFRCVSATRPTIYVPWPSEGQREYGEPSVSMHVLTLVIKCLLCSSPDGSYASVALPCSSALSLRALILQSLPLLLWGLYCLCGFGDDACDTLPLYQSVLMRRTTDPCRSPLTVARPSVTKYIW